MNKNIIQKWTAGLILSLSIFGVQGCDDPIIENGKVTEANSSSVFRNIFYNYLKNDYTEDEIRKMVYVTNPQLSQVPANMDPAAPFQGIDDVYKTYRPSDLYAAGKEEPFYPVENMDAVFEGKGPVTLVVVPGLMGELLDIAPFQSVLDGKGTFYEKWNPLLKEAKGEVYKLSELGTVETSLDKLVRIASIDDAQGRPKINLIFLQPMKGSLETFGTIQANTEVYQQRLNKVFAIIDAQDTPNLYTVGYSRGTPVGLDLIVKTRAEADKYTWSKRIRGHVGLVGVFYGSEMAQDAVYNPDSPLNATLNAVQEFADSLQEEPSLQSEINNKKALAAVVKRLAEIQKNSDGTNNALALEKEHYEMDPLSLKSGGHFLFQIAVNYFDPDLTGQEHFRNVKRFRILANKIIAAVNSLTVNTTMDWWASNVVPADIKILSVNGTMPDVTEVEPDGPVFSELMDSPYYGIPMPDFQMMLRGNFYDTYRATGVQLNDSQITMQRSRYWSELGPVLNPEQERLEHYYLSPMGTHHWGIALHEGVDSINIEENPFPRAVLLESIGTFIAAMEQ